MNASLVRITFEKLDKANIPRERPHSVSCSCLKYKQTRRCAHIDAVLNFPYNAMRLFSFPARDVQPTTSKCDHDKWDCIISPVVKSDNVKIWYTYQRMRLSSVFPTSSAVLFDSRESRAG